MSALKLQIDDFYSSDYEVIALHTTLKEHKLAYKLNEVLEIHLEKKQETISSSVSGSEAHFSWFEYWEENTDMDWNLLSNKAITKTAHQSGLFANEEISVKLLPELSKTDFLLKIEHTDDFFSVDAIIKKISKIEGIVSVYEVDKETIKSINNLIF
jgi:hypothetical protein